ncbi:MAG: cell wall hydrolase [Clostridia bacterium]|nr:cell wall hydrolase [Clostridia bacterium]
MKFTLRHIHRNSATDRTSTLPRLTALSLAVLVSVSALLPTAVAMTAHPTAAVAATQSPSPTDVTRLQGIESDLFSTESLFALQKPLAARPEATDSSDETDEILPTADQPDETTESNEEFVDDLFDPSLPLTQELIARRVESQMNKQVRGGTKINYPWPSGAMAVDLYKDGRQILKGQVADISGTVYVPVQRFADLFGTFKTVYTEATEQVVITGTNLSITVKVGDPYITVNERIFYTGKKVISLGGWIFVPLTSMCKALNATVNIRSGYYDAFITSGDVTKVKWASEYYNSTDLYWLSRIISAEARGEPFAGQIAVGNVVLNRMRNSQFPNTVKGVIFDTKYGVQFSPVSSGTIYNTPTTSAVMAAKICLEGYSLSTSMIYFYNPAIATSSWIGRTRPYIMTIGNHKFYG